SPVSSVKLLIICCDTSTGSLHPLNASLTLVRSFSTSSNRISSTMVLLAERFPAGPGTPSYPGPGGRRKGLPRWRQGGVSGSFSSHAPDGAHPRRQDARDARFPVAPAQCDPPLLAALPRPTGRHLAE